MHVDVAWAALALDLGREQHEAVIAQVGVDALADSVTRSGARYSLDDARRVSPSAVEAILSACTAGDASRLLRRVDCDGSQRIVLRDHRSSIRVLGPIDVTGAVGLACDVMDGIVGAAHLEGVWSALGDLPAHELTGQCRTLRNDVLWPAVLQALRADDEVARRVLAEVVARRHVLAAPSRRTSGSASVLAGLLLALDDPAVGGRLASLVAGLRVPMAQALDLCSSLTETDDGPTAAALDSVCRVPDLAAELARTQRPRAALRAALGRAIVELAGSADGLADESLREAAVAWADTEISRYLSAHAAAPAVGEHLLVVAQGLAAHGIPLDADGVSVPGPGVRAVRAVRLQAALRSILGVDGVPPALTAAVDDARAVVASDARALGEGAARRYVQDCRTLAAEAAAIGASAAAAALRGCAGRLDALVDAVGDPCAAAFARARALPLPDRVDALHDLAVAVDRTLAEVDAEHALPTLAGVLAWAVEQVDDGQPVDDVSAVVTRAVTAVGEARHAPRPMVQLLRGDAAPCATALLLGLRADRRMAATTGELEQVIARDLARGVALAAEDRHQAATRDLSDTAVDRILAAAVTDPAVAAAALGVAHPRLAEIAVFNEPVGTGGSLRFRRQMSKVAAAVHDVGGVAGLQVLSTLVDDGWDGTWGELVDVAVQLTSGEELAAEVGRDVRTLAARVA